MKREIKFRVWDTKSESMEHEIAIGKGYGEDSYILFLGIGETFIIDDDIVKIMQYTGLKDKNDVEIYEGDILKSDINETFGLVCFEDGKFVVNWENISEDLFEWTGEFVIGNIYETPELLN